LAQKRKFLTPYERRGKAKLEVCHPQGRLQHPSRGFRPFFQKNK
jgi:hypothetical protein